MAEGVCNVNSDYNGKSCTAVNWKHYLKGMSEALSQADPCERHCGHDDSMPASQRLDLWLNQHTRKELKPWAQQ